MEKIKILQIITKLELGGAQLSTLELIKGLDKNIYDVYLISSSEGILIDDALAIPNLNTHWLKSLEREVNIFYDLKTLLEIYRFIKSNKIDVVHTHSSKAGILGRWAAKLASVKLVVHTVHGWSFHGYQNRIVESFYMFLERVTAKITDKFIAVTRYDISKGLDNGIGVESKYSLIRYGIEKERFGASNNGSFRKKVGIENGCFVVGMIACFKPQKSPLDFVSSAAEVARRIPGVKFVMVGDGRLRGDILKSIEKFDLRERFMLLGWQRNIPEIMSVFDVLVSTSLWEGLPIVYLEAMASRKPIIATDIGGNSEVVQDGVNGFLVGPKDPYALIDRIVALSKDRSLTKRMGDEGRGALSAEYELRSMVGSINNLYLSGLKHQKYAV
ncbi:glycosyltransferase family 4 protein [Candidatus Omnitrophota bacterium]